MTAQIIPFPVPRPPGELVPGAAIPFLAGQCAVVLPIRIGCMPEGWPPPVLQDGKWIEWPPAIEPNA